MSKGNRAIKGLDEGSAFGLLVLGMRSIDPPIYRALRRWAAQLNLTDSGKGCRDSVVLAELVKAWRSLGLGDKGCFKRAKELIQGKINSERSNHRQKQRAKSVKIDKGVAVISDGTRIRAAHVFQQGAKALIRESDVGHSIMFSRELLKKGIKLNDLAPVLEPKGWFVHPDGFLACYGSVKAPKNYRKSGFTIDEIVSLVTTFLIPHVQLTTRG